MAPLLTVIEVAAILKVHPNTVYEKAYKADIPSVRTSTSRIRFRERDIKEWIDRRPQIAFSPIEQMPRFNLNLEYCDRILQKRGRIAGSERLRRRWDYGFGFIIFRKTPEGGWSIAYRNLALSAI